MRIYKQFFKSIALTALLFTGFAVQGIAQDTTMIVNPETKAPVIVTTSPGGGEMNVRLGSVIEITFSNDMDENSINGTTLMLHATSMDTMHKAHSKVILDDQIRDRSAVKGPKNSWQSGTNIISGTISYSNKVAVFTPDSELKEGTVYTFTVTNDVRDLDNVALENDQNWSFTTTGTPDSTYFDKQNDRSAMGGPENSSMKANPTNKTELINLGKAAHFVILAKRYINNESGSKISGHIGEGSLANKTKKEKASQQSTTSKSLEMKSSKSDTSSSDISKALQDMMAAYADAAMLNGDDVTTHNTKSFHHDPVLAPGVHEWSDSLQITSDVSLSGSADDVWIFKTSKNLTVNENTVFTLTNGARAENVFWYIEGDVTIRKNVQFEGVILSMNEITLEQGAKLNGRMFSQTSINLDDNTITQPRSLTGQTTSKNE